MGGVGSGPLPLRSSANRSAWRTTGRRASEEGQVSYDLAVIGIAVTVMVVLFCLVIVSGRYE